MRVGSDTRWSHDPLRDTNKQTRAVDQTAEFLFHECAEAADASNKELKQEHPESPWIYRLVFWVRYQRPYDKKRYERAIRLDLRWNSANEIFAIRSDLTGEPEYSN